MRLLFFDDFKFGVMKGDSVVDCSSVVDVVPVTKAVCERAAAIRAQYRFRPLDALHLAAAVDNQCSRFVTNDVRLKGFPDIAVEVLP